MTAYYNEFDPFAAQWLRNLIAAGHIAPGDVDERPIQEVQPDEVRRYTQCHFFAGVGGWSLALRLASWPDDRSVWTGSCPCQPFSAAGKGKAFTDDRHLWPEWFRLIRECRPSIIFGEQVSRAIGWGWLDLVSTDVEGEGYAIGSAVLPACSVGAPHKRDRLWFVGHANKSGSQRWRRTELSERASECIAGEASKPRGMADAENTERGTGERGTQAGVGPNGERGRRPASGGAKCVADAECGTAERYGPELAGAPNGMQGAPQQRERIWDDVGDGGNPWADLLWLPCRDGKARPTQPGLFPLAHGVSARVGRLRAYGNAIVPQVAAVFIEAAIGH